MERQPERRPVFNVRRGDPRGGNARGIAPGYSLNRGASGNPLIEYRGIILEFDVYQPPNLPGLVHISCPVCFANGRDQALLLHGDHTSFSYEPSVTPVKLPSYSIEQLMQWYPGCGGRFSMDRIRCTWEAEPGMRVLSDPRCSWQVVVENNVARDVR